MEIQNYNLDDPIPTSCAPWGSLDFPKQAPTSRNITATEVDMLKEEAYKNWVIKETAHQPIPDELFPYLKKKMKPFRSLGHINDQAQKKKENNMCYNAPNHASVKSTGAVASIQVAADRSDENKRQHLIQQLRQSKWMKRYQAEKFFNLHVDNSPKNFRELLAAIKDGKFSIDEKRAAKIDAKILNGEPTYGALDGIIWDGPQKDCEGYEKFSTYLDDEYQKANDEIIVLPLEKGLEALRRFQALEVAAIKA